MSDAPKDSKRGTQADLPLKEIRAATNSALQSVSHLPPEALARFDEKYLFAAELLHAQACALDEHEPFQLDAGLLVSLLALLLRSRIRCTGFDAHEPPEVPTDWNCADPLFCLDCIDSADREVPE